MSMIQQQTLKKAIVLLEAIGVSYAVIDQEGNKHGKLEVVEAKAKRAKSKHPRGYMSDYAESQIGHLKVGDIVEVDVEKLGKEGTRGAITAWACNNWGNGKITTAFNKQTNKIEVLRIEQ
jgi:hypothetical protein